MGECARQRAGVASSRLSGRCLEKEPENRGETNREEGKGEMRTVLRKVGGRAWWVRRGDSCTASSCTYTASAPATRTRCERARACASGGEQQGVVTGLRRRSEDGDVCSSQTNTRTDESIRNQSVGYTGANPRAHIAYPQLNRTGTQRPQDLTGPVHMVHGASSAAAQRAQPPGEQSTQAIISDGLFCVVHMSSIF